MLEKIFNELTNNETVCTSKIAPYKKSLEILLNNYYNGLNEILYKTDSYGVCITILKDPMQDCYLEYIDSIGGCSSKFNEEEFEEFTENFLCYVGTMENFFNY